MRIQPDARLLFTGDSVTDCGRTRPIGLGPDGLGTGYVAAIASSHSGEVLNTGVSGDRSRDLVLRLQTDVIHPGADATTVLIGINDVWRRFDRPEDGVSDEEFKVNLEHIVASSPGLRVVMGAFLVEPDRAEPMRAEMEGIAALARQVATDLGAVFVDLQGAFDQALGSHSPADLAPDRIHPTPLGHGVIAAAWRRAVDQQS